jgi:TrmH family RNA methyltransferase
VSFDDQSEELITSRRNPLVRRLRSLSSRSGRDEHGVVLLEGTHQIQELRTHVWPDSVVLDVVATPAWLNTHAGLIHALPGSVRVQRISDEALQAGLTTVQPDGVACLLPLSCLPSAVAAPEFVLALDRIQDPGNLGTLLRTARAADIQQVWCASGADPLAPKVVRSSAGAILSLPVERFGPDPTEGVVQLAERLRQVRDAGLQIVATLVPDAAAERRVQPYWELDWTLPTVLLLGNEGAGLDPLLQDCCSAGVTLPHSAAVESLNVAAAAVPLLLERRRARMTPSTQKIG